MGAIVRVGDRPYLRHPKWIASRLGVGLVALKLGETAAVSASLVKARITDSGHGVEGEVTR
jgi:hypothetical protein